ncbi:MAG: strawberry notch family protein [Clostridia bacterium]|nr:strawberry notch family protein [Clostridia bacterium]
MANWQESAKKSLDNRKNNTNNTSSATSAPAVVSAPKVIDAPKSTDTWQGKAQQSLNKRGYVPPENRMYSLKTNDGQDFGIVSYGAYKAIENNNLDSYTPKTAEEKASIDSFKAYAQEQYEKQQEAEKQKRINSNPTFARYNIDPADFDYDDLIKWAGEHNHTMRVDGSMRTYFTPNYKGGFLGIGGKKLSTDEEDADMEVLYQTAMNNTRAELAQKDLGAFMSAIVGFGDGMSFGAIPALSDWSAKKQYEDAGLDSETFVSPSQTYAKTVSEHGISNAVGDIGGSLVSLGAVGKVVGTATKGIKWLSSAPKWVQSAVNSGITFSAVGATETAFDGGNAEEILRSAGINLVGGAVGGSLSSVVGSLGEKFLFSKGLQHKVIPEIIRNGLSSAAYAGGNTLATSFLYPEGYKPTAEEVAKDLAVAFAFGSISSAINVAKTSTQNKKYLDSLNNKMAADYENMARANISNKSDIAGIRKFAKNVVGYSNAMEAYLTGKEYSATINGETYTFTPNKVRLVGQDKYVQSMLNDLQTIRNNANAVLNGVGTPTTDLATTPGATPGATPTASVPPVSSASSSVPATKEAIAPVNVAEATPTVPPVVSAPVVAEATPAVKNTNDFTDELSEVASAGAVAKYAPEGASADVVSLENKLINVGASDVDRQKVVETAIAVESTLVGTDKSLKDVLADTTNITGSAVTAFKQSVGAPKNYWSLFNTNLKTIAALQTKENFIVDYANTFAETLQSTDSVMSRAVVDSGIDVASAVSQYALTGNVPEEVKNETVLSGLSKAFTAITEPVLSQIDTAHIAIYGDARTQEPTPEMPAETQTAPTEVQPATTNELQPEEAQKYNIVVSNLKRKAEELGLLDSKFFTALQNVDLYKPSASDRALISSEFHKVFAGNTDPLVTNWLDSISEDVQPVTTTNSEKAVVTEEITPVNTATTNTEVNSGIVTLKKSKSIYSVFKGAEKVVVGADTITDGKIAIPLTDNALKAVKKAYGGEVTENSNYSLDRIVPKNTTVEITGDPKLRTIAKENGTNLETYVFKIGDKYYSCPQKYLDAVNNGKNRVFANETVSPWVVNDEKGNFVAVIMPVNATVTDAVYDSLQLASEKVEADNAHKAALKSAPFNKNEKSYLFSTGRIATADYDGHTYITNGGLVIRTDPASLDFIKTEFKDEYGKDIASSDAVTRSIEAYTGFNEAGKIEKAIEHNTYHPTKKKKDGTPKVEEYRTALIADDKAFLFDKHFMDMLKKRSAELKILSDGQMKNTALVGYDTNGNVTGLLLPMFAGKGDLFVEDNGKKYYFLDKFKVGENQPKAEPVTPEKTTDLKKEVKSDTIKAEENPVEAAPVEETPEETYTPKVKEDFKVGDVLEFDGEQWECAGIDTMMIDFVNVNKDASQHEMSVILPYELFKEKTDYKVVKRQGEATTQPEVDKKSAENKEVVLTTEQQTDISKKAVNDVAEFVRGKLARGSKISSATLFDTAKAAYGGSMADGVFTPKDAYDAMELGVNKYILSLPNVSTQKMLDILDLLPTQTKRTEEMIKYQQFSTPPSIAYLANYVANINSNDVMLEPSAGIGGIAVFAKRDGATVYVNELDPRRLDIVKELPFDGFYNENAEQIDNILGGEIQPSVIVMNPPFSSSSERNIKGTKIGAKHIEQALQILAPGGRLVAIVGNGMAPDAPAFRQWWKDISAKYNVKANIGINGKNYTKYGTNFNIQMLVIDKDGSTTAPTKVGTVDTLQELESMLGGIRDERPTFDYSKLERTAPGAVEQKATAISKAGDQRNDAVLDTSSAAGSKQPTDGAVSSREPKREVAPKTSSKPGSTSAATPTATDTTANEPGLTGTREPGGSVGVQDSNGAVNGADKQSDLQPGLQGSDGNSGNGLAPSRVSRLKHTELTDSIFEQYQTAPLLIEGAKQHPAKVSESAAMSAIEAPAITYKPTLPQKVITDGVVSDVQLESISRAGQSHSQILPNGTRRGYFMGDGTGIGKGRTIAGIILDNYNQGRKKAVWVTLNSSLVNDAKRDVKAVFGSPDLVTQFVGGNKADQIMGQDEGILVVSYSSLSRAFDSPGSNFEKIVKWLGKDFDGVIVFDEAHKMGNSSDTKGSRGVKKASQTGLSGIAFQEALPKARIVYSSATGATEVENLRYAERLGLWGDGTAFASGDDFVSKIKAGGLAAMELVARDLKAMGVYLSRNISYDGVEYDKIEHTLTPQQEQIYNELARSWQVVLQNINKALETTNQSKDGHARGRALGAFWSSQQRFFNQILTSMQAPSVIADIEKQLADGKSCVIQLVSTNESAQNEEFARLQAEDLTLDDFDLTPKQMLMSFIEKSFPVQQFEDYIDDNGNKRSKPVYDSKGKPVLNREAIKQRDELLAKLGSIKVPSSPIDMIISHFGTDMVAENTGRQRRVIEKNGKMVEEKIGSKKDADVDAFQNGKKRIIIFSKAGGTGKSYHADKSAKNQQQRVHYVYEPGWQADNAVQGFGRTNRSNQAVPPIYKLVTTNLKGQMRFISTIAKRLDQLGAMTKGQRQAGSTGLFSSEDNLESALASDVLAVFYKDLARDSAEGVDDGLAILEKLGLKDKIIDEYGSIITTAPELREVNKFLNRILTLETHEQNAVFDCYSNRLQEATEIAKQNGTLDKGLENYKADKISLNEEKDIREDESTGATTKYYNLTAEHKLHPTTFADVETNRSNFVGFYQHRTNQSVRAVFKTSSTTDQYGNVHNNFKFVGPAKYDYAPELRLYSNWEKIEEADAKKLWDAELAILPEYRKENLHLIGGVVLPVWDKLPDENVRIYRVLTDKGDMLIGRVVPEDRIDETLRRLGSSRTKEAVPTKDIIAGIKRGDTVYLDNGWRIVQRKVANENRIEIIGPEYFNYDKLKSKGVFSERISYNTRYFIPAGDNAVSVFDEVLKISPVLRVENTRLALGGINDERGSSASESEEWRDFQPASKKGKPIFTDRKGNLGRLGRKKYCEALKADEVEYKTVNGAIRTNFVKEYAYNDDMKNIVSDLQRQGYKKVGFYVGGAHLLYSPGAQCGAITFGEDGVFDEIYIRYDDPDYSPRQLGLHEVGHQIYNTPYGQKIANIIKNSMSFTERARVLSSERYQRYMAVLKNKDLVFEEFVCDILGGMTKYADAFEDIATAFRNNDKAYIDNYKVSEYNKLIDTGDPNASVLESIGLGNDYRLSESFGDIPYREYVQLRNYIVQKNNSTDALLSTDCKEIGDNFYIWNNTSKTDFTVVGSIPIVGNEDFINAIRSEITNGTYRGTENFNTRANRIRSGKRGRAVLDGRTSRSATDGNNDRLSVRQPESDTRRNLVENSGTDTPVSQTFKSAGTSLNQVAALFKNKNFHPGKVNIDIGGGKFDATSNFLRSLGTENYVFDPFNRTEQENTATLDFLMSGKKADTATCANVLNVIDTEAARLNVILETAKAIKPDGTAYFTVYTSDNSGVGRQTQADSWQNARKTEDYVSEIETYFNNVERKGSIIIAKEPKADLPQASWEVKPGKAFRYALSTYDTDSESLTPERKKQIFEQFEKDRAGMPKQTKKEIWGERAAWVANNMTRVFPEIPERGEKGTFFAEFRKNMVQWKNLANTASFMVQDKLNKMTEGLTPEEFKTFSELVYFLDLQEEAQIQRERGYSEILLPNEITPGEVDEIIKVLNKEATENVRQALIKRQNIWDELKDQYISLNQYIGFDTDGKFKRKNYYHHQIIEYMNGKGSGTGSREIGIKAGRGWLKERQGSTKAINTDFLAVEYKAMLQMQYDVYIANMLGKIKKQYDIKPQLEQQAFKNNKQMLNEIIAKEATDKDGNILYDQKGQPDSETYRQQLWYNQRIMFGFNGLFDLAERNALPTFDGEYSAVVNALKMHNLNVAGLYKYVGVLANMELPENATDAQEQALINSRTVLKYTAQKRAWIKELLGDQYQTWETLAREMSDTHTIHQPRRGNYFYTKTTIDEDAFNKAFNEMILSLTSGDYSFESVDDVKKLFTQYADTIRLMGAAYEQWVLPKEIVSTMDSVANPKQSHSMAQAARGIVSAWKGWATSVNPLRTIKFGLRNLYGDLDAVIAGKPQVVKYSKRAAQEIYQAMRHKKYTPEFMEWVERGGYTSMIFANEMDAEMQDKLFAHLKDKTGKGIFDIPAKLFEGYYDGVKTAHDFREAILRYSAYLYFKEMINKNGGVVTDNVASNRYIIKGLHSVEDKAYQLSKDLLGAYDEVGKMGQTLRRYWIPFYSFTETNLKRYYRMFENIIASNDDIPKKAGKLLLKALMVNMLGLLMIAWNKLVMKDADDQLPPSVRNVPHLTLGKVGDDVYAFRQLGSFSEILEWIGLDDYKWTSEDFVAPLDKAWGMITPFVKLPVELASGLNFYPSLTEPRAIRDKWQHFFNSLGVDDIYSEVTGKPTKGVGEILKGGLVYSYDYQESAYYEILDIKRNYQGSNDNTIYGTDAKSNALYYMKTAIRYNDKKAALKYLDEYFEHGGTGKGIKQSFATLNPMYGYTSKDNIEKGNAFIASLTDDEKEKLKIAQDYYEKELMLPESVSSRLGKKDITDEEAKNLLRNYINSQCK